MKNFFNIIEWFVFVQLRLSHIQIEKFQNPAKTFNLNYPIVSQSKALLNGEQCSANFC